MMRSSKTAFALILFAFFAIPLHAQDNYEIQVYGADTVAPRTTMLELHSNFTFGGSHALPGSAFTPDGTEPTNHALHETIEITQGLNDWAEVGFYIFTSARDGQGYQWVGDHIRPRVRVPDKWHWPVGVSLSNEVGYQRARFSPDTWNWEIRPIIDKKIGRLYLAFNPAIDRAWHGPGVDQGMVFSPNFKAGYDFLKWKSRGYEKTLNAGLEYYGSLGPVGDFDPLRDQQQQIVPSVDLDVSPDWEINFGVGVGVTQATDHLIIKGIIGRRFSWDSMFKRGTSKGDQKKPGY